VACRVRGDVGYANRLSVEPKQKQAAHHSGLFRFKETMLRSADSTLIQNSQSLTGTMISAFGNASEPSAAADAVGVIGMQMRQQHDVDTLEISACGGEILQRAADGSLGGLEVGDTVAGVDQHQLEPVLMSCGLNGTVTMPFCM
jgi:hypothetical protein